MAQRGPVMGIGEAVEALQDGLRVARSGWNGKGMWLELVVPNEQTHPRPTLPYVNMFTPQGMLVPWLCSQTDLLATDWEVVDV